MRRHRQFRAEDVQLLQIEVQDAARLQPQRAPHHLGRDERVAVAVAADPASHLEERGQFAPRGAIAVVQPVLQRAMQPRHLAQERVIVERQAVGDLVKHRELGPAQQVGLPQRHHLAAQLLVVGRRLLRREPDTFAPVEQRGDLHLPVHGALAADFGRVGGQHRADLGCLEETAQIGGADAGRTRMRQRLTKQAGARRAVRPGGSAQPADVVLVLGDVGKMREIAEGAHDPHGLADRHAVEDQFQLLPCRPVVVAMEPDRGLPDAFDEVEDVGPLLISHGIAEDAPEQADVVAQAGVFLLPVGLFRVITASFGPGRQGLGRHDLGRHEAGYSRGGPAEVECASFLPQCKMKMEAHLHVPAAGFRPGDPSSLALSRRKGAGKPGGRRHPQYRVRRVLQKKHTGLTGTARTSRPSPRNGWTAYFAISPGNGLSCPRCRAATRLHG